MKKFLTLLSVAAILIFSACTKITSTDLGAGVIPPIDGVNTFEQFLSVDTRDSLSLDSIAPISSATMVLGKIDAGYDPVFGETNAIMNFEVKPSYFPFSFAGDKTTRTIDSVVLVIGTSGFYGDTLISQNLSVYELGEEVPNDTLNKTNRQFARTALLASANVSPTQVNDSMYMFREQATNQIRIKLPNSFGTRFINYDSVFSLNQPYASDSLFTEAFKGFSVESSNGKGLFYTSLTDTNTKVAFYYKSKATPSATTVDTTVTYFKFNTYYDGYSNNIKKRNSGTSEAGTNLASISPLNDTALYIETAPGTHVRVRIPDLATFPNKIIHRAELIFEELTNNNAAPLLGDIGNQTFSAPNIFVAAAIKDSTRKFFLPYSTTSSGVDFGTLGGKPFKKTVGSQTINAYNINFTRYVQGIITRGEDIFDLYLYAPYDEYVTGTKTDWNYYSVYSGFNQLATGRVRVGGGNNKLQPMRLRIIYSNL